MKSCNTPMQPHLQLHKDSDNSFSEPIAYRILIDRLLYFTHSRVEISYVVSKLSQFLSAPTNKHMLAGLRVLKYLKGSLENGFFSSSSTLTLKGLSYSDWGAYLNTIRFTIDLCFFLGSSLVSWKTRSKVWFQDHHLRLSIKH